MAIKPGTQHRAMVRLAALREVAGSCSSPARPAVSSQNALKPRFVRAAFQCRRSVWWRSLCGGSAPQAQSCPRASGLTQGRVLLSLQRASKPHCSCDCFRRPCLPAAPKGGGVPSFNLGSWCSIGQCNAPTCRTLHHPSPWALPIQALILGNNIWWFPQDFLPMTQQHPVIGAACGFLGRFKGNWDKSSLGRTPWTPPQGSSVEQKEEQDFSKQPQETG